MKVRICFLVMSLSALIYYGATQLAPSGRAATVSSTFHALGKTALTRIESAQEADSEPEYQARMATADSSLDIAHHAVVSPADEREFTQLLSYMQAVKQDHVLAIAAGSPDQPPDHEAVNHARAAAENTFK